ncbi:MAG: HPF/RaiA family ribosome-associated protein [Patescibacteria group bacterium]
MNVIIQSNSLPVSEAIRNFCQKHCRKLFSKGAQIDKITIFLDKVVRKKNDSKAASAKLHISTPGKDIVIKRQAHDLYNAIVDVANRAQRTLIKKNKKKRMRRKKNRDIGLDWIEWAY